MLRGGHAEEGTGEERRHDPVACYNVRGHQPLCARACVMTGWMLEQLQETPYQPDPHGSVPLTQSLSTPSGCKQWTPTGSGRSTTAEKSWAKAGEPRDSCMDAAVHTGTDEDVGGSRCFSIRGNAQDCYEDPHPLPRP
jgi:hypothetical protein